MTIQELNKEIGNIDIYLFDQILKGRYVETKNILDAGCGEGRNLNWFLRNNYSVFGIDKNASAIKMLQFVARGINPAISRENFIVSPLEKTSFPDASFDAIICSAVLHFADNEMHFYKMLDELMRLLTKKGILFIRMASNIGAEDSIKASTEEKVMLPDGSARFLLSRSLLEDILKNYPLTLLEPVKTVNVQDVRFMTTLVLEKA